MPRWLWLAILCAACGATQERPRLRDDGWRDTPGRRAAEPATGHDVLPESQRSRWRYADAIRELNEVEVAGPSEHLGGTYLRRVRVNAMAAAYASVASPRPMPPGALVVQEHIASDGRPMITYAMLKGMLGSAPESGDWDFVVLDAELRSEVANSPPACVRCHAEAPHDLLFGPEY